MRVIIVGAGIAGLSLAIALGQSGHQITILDAAAQLAELGAGVQMTPQAIRYLFKWGLKDDLLSESIIPEDLYVRDGHSGDLLGTVRIKDMEAQYGAPYIVVHRAVLHAILHRHAIRAGAQLLLESDVVEYEFANGAVQLRNGNRLAADLVVAADGINSLARSKLLGSSDPGSQPTGWAAFRVTAEVSKLRADPAVASLIDLQSRSSNWWIAPQLSCMTYLIKDATLLNIVLSHRDDINTKDFTAIEYNKTVRNRFKDFESRVQRILNLSRPQIVNYPVYAVPPLPSWTHESGRFVLLGDAAHAMAFYMSMGVSIAVEDAAALVAALDLACPPDTGPNFAHGRAEEVASRLKHALRVFETVRKPRVEAVQEASLHGGDSSHTSDEMERSILYEALGHSHETEVWPLESDARRGEFVRKSRRTGQRLGPGGIIDKGTRDWCYDYDAVRAIEEAYKSSSTAEQA
ncbi:FAD/NAD(P)-binding domain-containing protein [Trichoderma longibrachiatum ATCC 18648]|uniref:FAD/NAD(P)-binding domain-containing protein n=1 Tax=Trichoderma longibrachiatum ATCC 18648 TaxID=983965 RepID=A0A2T4CIX3_TRILO|nr:FAD/NAD(P)-binding domain-containing protein [Trichoderma longibrachiatum ATCC 18648]